jgi:hypothetical protein
MEVKSLLVILLVLDMFTHVIILAVALALALCVAE